MLEIFFKYLKSRSAGKKTEKNAGDEMSQIKRLAEWCTENDGVSYRNLLNLEKVQELYLDKMAKDLTSCH